MSGGFCIVSDIHLFNIFLLCSAVQQQRVCPSACLPQAGIELKQITIGSLHFRRRVTNLKIISHTIKGFIVSQKYSIYNMRNQLQRSDGRHMWSIISTVIFTVCFGDATHIFCQWQQGIFYLCRSMTVIIKTNASASKNVTSEKMAAKHEKTPINLEYCCRAPYWIKIKVKQGHTLKERRRVPHLPFIGCWARRWNCLWRMASVPPDLRLPSQPKLVLMRLPTEGRMARLIWPGWLVTKYITR